MSTVVTDGGYETFVALGSQGAILENKNIV